MARKTDNRFSRFWHFEVRIDPDDVGRDFKTVGAAETYMEKRGGGYCYGHAEDGETFLFEA